MRLALAQINPHVGDVAGNVVSIQAAYADAVSQGASLVVVGELALTGYPPEDLVLKPAFVQAVRQGLDELAAATGPVPLVVGFVEEIAEASDQADAPVLSEATAARRLANAAGVLRGGRVDAIYRKHRIPNYGVFDEARYFRAGGDIVVFEAGERHVGVTVCEDLWRPGGPVQRSAAAGADVVLNLNASPYQAGKRTERQRWAAEHARAGGVYVAYVNLVGGQDEVVFDGDSFVMGPDGEVVARGTQFAPDLVLVDVPTSERATDDHPDLRAETYAALVLATRDYLRKNGFDRALVGLSGGVDSSLTATIAADAVGGENVTGVAMPSPHSSPGSVEDAQALSTNLGIHYLELSIEAGMQAFDVMLAGPFRGTEPGVAEENIQARVRGMLLMALSNKFGDLVLAAGNKSELAVGYATLYGDMAGGFAVLKDVWKTLVYQLCHHRNRDGEVIPWSVITKPPSAELRPGQQDTDALPPYEVLDPILEAYVEEHRSASEIVADGHDPSTVQRMITLVDRAEYKRRQAAPGVKVTPRAFGRDRRLPITQQWSG